MRMAKLLIIGYVWPEPTSSAAGQHMMDIILPFHQSGWHITFATPAAESKNKFDLAAMGIDEKVIELNSSTFDSWLMQLQPDAVIFDRFMMEEQFGWRVSRVSPDALKILDTEDLHFLRHARQKTQTAAGNLVDIDLNSKETLRELASIYRCDLTLIISHEEIRMLTAEFSVDEALLHYYPVLVHGIAEKLLSFDERANFVFVGTMRHAPNLDAVRRLKKKLWPNIRKRLPQANLYIIGSYATDEITQMHQPASGFHVLGYVKDLQQVLRQSRVMLAPLQFGAGIKGKLLESMQYGLPSVTTAIGAEGIASHDHWPGTIVENDEQFIDAAISLYQDKPSWQSAQKRGADILKSKFLYADHANLLVQRVENLMDNLIEHRKENFIGQMLNLNNMKSTEYMSRWIECKNKNSRDSGS